MPFRHMTSNDLPTVMELEQSTFHAPWTERMFQDCIKAGYLCELLEDAQKSVGFIVYYIRAGECHILNICVKLAERRKGYGKKLLEHAIKTVEKNETKAIFLEVRQSNQAATALYQKMGFKEIGKRKKYYPMKGEREDAIVLRKNSDDHQ